MPSAVFSLIRSCKRPAISILQNFVDILMKERKLSITIDDGDAALRAGIAATHSCQSGQPVEVATIGV
jgi:hypothetical protein